MVLNRPCALGQNHIRQQLCGCQNKSSVSVSVSVMARYLHVGFQDLLLQQHCIISVCCKNIETHHSCKKPPGGIQVYSRDKPHNGWRYTYTISYCCCDHLHIHDWDSASYAQVC